MKEAAEGTNNPIADIADGTPLQNMDHTKMNKAQLDMHVLELQQSNTGLKAELGTTMGRLHDAENRLKNKWTGKELHGEGYFHRGNMLSLGIISDIDNLFDDPTWQGKVYHAASGIAKGVGAVAAIKVGYNLVSGYLARRAAAKAVGKLTGMETGEALDTSLQATAAIFGSHI